MRHAILIIALLLPQLSPAAEWKQVQDRGDSVTEVDMQSISRAGAMRQATVREVFKRPDRLSSGKDYDVREMHMQVNCGEKSAAIRKVLYYLKGKLVHTLTVPPQRAEFMPMAGDAEFSGIACRHRPASSAEIGIVQELGAT